MLLPLFVYGPLRDPDLAMAVLGRPLRMDAIHAAAAPGFRAVTWPGRTSPALIRTPGAAAPGLLLTDLTPFERDLLDAWAGDGYARHTIARCPRRTSPNCTKHGPTCRHGPCRPTLTIGHFPVGSSNTRRGPLLVRRRKPRG